MAKRIIKKLGGDRIGSGNKMNVAMHGYGYSTHDVSKIRRTSMSFGTIVPMGIWLMTHGSRLRLRLDALITSNALLYQLYGSAKFQLDVFSARLDLYNPKMLVNLNDQGYNIGDIKFPQMSLTTRGFDGIENISNRQVNPSALLRYLGIAGNGQKENFPNEPVTRLHNAQWLLFYYQTVKEYYANKQEKVGYMIHQPFYRYDVIDMSYEGDPENFDMQNTGSQQTPFGEIRQGPDNVLRVYLAAGAGNVEERDLQGIRLYLTPEDSYPIRILFERVEIDNVNKVINLYNPTGSRAIYGWEQVTGGGGDIRVEEYDLKAIDRMTMRILANVESNDPIIINQQTELPYGASFLTGNNELAINYPMEGLALGTYQSDVFNNWLDNETINDLNNRNKVKVDENGEFSIDMLNITQKLYNYNMRIGVTDGTLDEYREVTYGVASKGRALKPVYEGGLTKEIVFDQVVSTAGTEEEPLGSIASRGQFGDKHKGGYCQIEADCEKMVMVLAKITPRIVYNQGNDWTTTLKSLADLHKPAMDKIGYQNLITDTIAVFDTIVKADGSLVTKSAGKQPAWQWYRTSYDDALGNMADSEDYKVFGRTYEAEISGTHYRIKDLTTYIDPTKYNDVFAIKSLDAMNFDVQVGMDAKLTMVMSEEVIPNL